jgi:predicted RNase H-like HicB family nuclease
MAGYIALVHKDDGTSYGVSFPDVPGCVSAGDTFEEALANAADALTGHFALMKADAEPIPSPRSFEQLKQDPEFVEGQRRSDRDGGDAARDDGGGGIDQPCTLQKKALFLS